jgi:iron-sulfur cluster repair protein YtfE (RIC family)
MEKHKPIKRSKEFVQFSKEHHIGLLLVWQIRQDLAKNIEGAHIGNYMLDFFKNDLAKHFKEEEELIFSKLPAEDPLRKQAESEHFQLNLLNDSITINKSDKQLLHRFADLLEAHIRFEERILFNHIQEIMKPSAQ